MRSELETYLDDLARELATRGAAEARLLEEARAHLADATEAGIREGLAPAAAARAAITRFGPAATVATAAATRERVRSRLLLTAAVGAGLAIAWVDRRPSCGHVSRQWTKRCNRVPTGSSTYDDEGCNGRRQHRRRRDAYRDARKKDLRPNR